MKRLVLGTAVLAALMTVGCNQETKTEPTAAEATAKAPAEKVALTTDREKQAYALGVMFAQQAKGTVESLTDMGLPLDESILRKGIQDGLNDTVQLEEPEMKEKLQVLQKEHMELSRAAQEKAKEELAKQGEANKAAGAAFMAENAKKDGVKVTDSGLQYEVLTAGEGASPKATDVVKVHYKGTLIDGTKFDSSYDRGQPATFPLNQVIPGWTEGVQLMKVGSKYRFVIPAELAYGEHGAGPNIPPFSTLVFEVELLDVNPEEAAAAAE